MGAMVCWWWASLRSSTLEKKPRKKNRKQVRIGKGILPVSSISYRVFPRPFGDFLNPAYIVTAYATWPTIHCIQDRPRRCSDRLEPLCHPLYYVGVPRMRFGLLSGPCLCDLELRLPLQHPLPRSTARKDGAAWRAFCSTAIYDDDRRDM